MKSNLALNSDVIVSGAKQSGNFTIAANGKAFKILINGLYSNKIQAIVRELSSNAFDSHKDAGRGDTPFEITLPNILDPTFSVRDFGTSISHDNIMGLYTTVFQSTKEDTNNAVGKFGLGSKTPFAYTDSFTVTAFLRGTKRVYGAYMNEQDIPQISLMASENTSELDGLMISFPVNVADCEKFRLETERVLEGFDIKPIVKGNAVNFKVREPLFEGTCFKVFKNTNNRILARQGCVIYPIDSNALPTLNDAQRRVFKTDILIDFPIGELDVTPSRESLSYDKDTIDNILIMVEKIDTELSESVTSRFTSVRTMYEARCFKADNKYSSIPSIKHAIDTLKFRDKVIVTTSIMDRSRLKRNYNVGITYFPEFTVSRDKSTLRFNETQYSTTWEMDGETLFVMDHANNKINHVSARIKNNLGDKDNVLWIRDYGATPKQLKKLRKLLGFPPKIHNVSDFLLPERQKPVNTKPRMAKNECKVELVVNNNLVDDIIDLNNIDYDLQYVIAYKDEIRIDPVSNLSITVSDLKNYFTDLSRIVVVRKQHLAKIKNAGIPNGLERRHDELFKQIDFDKHFESVNLDLVMDHKIANHSDKLSNFKYENETSFKKVLDLLKIYDKRDDYKANDALVHLWQKLVISTEYRDLKNKASEALDLTVILDKAMTEFKNDYPLVRYILGDNQWTINMDTKRAKDMLDYVTLIDGTRT